MLPLITPINIPSLPPDSTVMNTIEKDLTQLTSMSWSAILDKLADAATSFGLKLIAALAVYIIGRWLIRRFDKLLHRVFTARKVDPSIDSFARNLLRVVSYVILVMIAVNLLGISTTSFLAIFGAAGLALGMALSGTLQNFAGGVMILALKPFRVGDYIQASGVEGTVKEIKLFSTLLLTSDNKTQIVPNGGLSTGAVNNFSREPKRRVDWTFGISYGDSYDKAKEVLAAMLADDKRIVDKPAEPFIALLSLGDSAVQIVVRAWVKSSDYWAVYFDLNERVYKEFPSHGLTIPYPKLDVNITKE